MYILENWQEKTIITGPRSTENTIVTNLEIVAASTISITE